MNRGRTGSEGEIKGEPKVQSQSRRITSKGTETWRTVFLYNKIVVVHMKQPHRYPMYNDVIIQTIFSAKARVRQTGICAFPKSPVSEIIV